ncbi:NgoBV family restriction endonuclease [Vibrio parahaemolyticus]|uniref:NgoBV family restriction endonuclease n=1 Tax=Vibrio parahaemolyticus TaxID=670 RepID=UPI00226A6C77|nr:NgoBV family restriction endonuclease [Vibrio parahaemolyticus]EGU4189123.1 NgoBV family restriction endonuclease [Vibrio parahaemolyticus]EJG0908007.1 NgoBV family restriction endonuclease [Vibrio parahaemolyticus]ELA9844206.1 NgoBV family restriction endonuclease [Vibrio parahaemolyticus]MCX8786404.1 NgoBV family restriction endonuclease [Vibrio parahaemolyticus]MCX8846497.1 NgoBV family restriction endonuclease [Vibrio parahaemolyticus]
MSYHEVSIDLFEQLQAAQRRGELVGGTEFSLGGYTISITSKDGVGKLIEEWLAEWAEGHDIAISPNEGGQEFPDFYIEIDDSYLEIKAFDIEASANFDIANFESYCESLSYNPSRLNADYLIFGYQLRGSELRIERIWLKKIWEISCPSERFPLKVQAKRDVIYNIRPAAWYSSRARTQVFRTANDFVNALYSTQKIYLNIERSEEEERFHRNSRR